MILRSLLFIILFLFSNIVHSAYEEKERTKVDLNHNGSATIYIKDDLLNKFDYVKYRKSDSSWITINAFANNEFTISGSGMYELKFHKNSLFQFWDGEVVWKQNIYIPYTSPRISEELAKQYRPTIVFNNGEEYFPQSLESILNYSENIDSIKISGIDGGSSHLMGNNIKKYLEMNGHSESYFDFESGETTCNISTGNLCENGGTALFLRFSNGSLDNSTVYWDASEENGNLYLTYYFFYAFDPKLGSLDKPALGAHAFDRESFTIKFSVEESNYTPTEITYAGHLPNQQIDFKGCENDNHTSCNSPASSTLISWNGGKTTISWNNIIKVGKHPVIYKAKGAHAIYPTYGYYTVVKVIDVLTEPAGSSSNSRLALPSSYDLQKLDYSHLGYLSFSGYWVDVRVASNAKFPPFIRTPYSTWLSDTNRVFDSCLNGIDNSDDCNNIKEYFKYVRGLNSFYAVTVEVRDSQSNEIIPNVQVRLQASDGSLDDVKTTLSDGIHTFFYVPKTNVTYQLSAYTPDFGEINCDRFVVIDTSQPITNNEQKRICHITLIESTGIIQGSVKDALLQTPILNAEIKVFKSGVEKINLLTDSSGNYSVELPTGDYSLTISAENYITEENILVTVTEDETTTVTTLRQVPTGYSGVGTVSGIIRDAISGNTLSSVSLQARKGINVTEGTVIDSAVTSSVGFYELPLDAGNYTIQARKEGYTSGYFNVVSIGNQTTDNQNSSISPIISEEEIRIILSWGASPSDLDSHLWTPSVEGNTYHIYFGRQGSNASAPYAKLDTDKRSGYGPETITIYKRFPGTYYYSVYNLSGSPDIKTSNARVEVYNSTGLIKSYNVPLSGEGRYWNIFSIDGGNGTISSINEISSSQPNTVSRQMHTYRIMEGTEPKK